MQFVSFHVHVTRFALSCISIGVLLAYFYPKNSSSVDVKIDSAFINEAIRRYDLGPCVENKSVFFETSGQQPCIPEPACIYSLKKQEIDILDYDMQLSKRTICDELVAGQRPSKDVEVSFITTNFNQPVVTSRCLIQLFRTAKEAVSVEYVVIDDKSTVSIAPLKHLINKMRDYFSCRVQFHVNSQNLGYSASNNKGVQISAGNYIVLLNNDVIPLQGWYTSLRQVFRQTLRVGIVGPLFLNLDMSISEAGGIIFNDGRAANYGRFQKLSQKYLYTRHVDYISAACIMLKKSTFTAVGGFDEQLYGKGYYEDTDLAMRLWQQNLSVIYQPLSMMMHPESTTMASSKSSLMRVNHQKFFNKWSNALNKHCSFDSDHGLGASRHRPVSVLWIDPPLAFRKKSKGILNTLLKLNIQITFNLGEHRPKQYIVWAQNSGIAISRRTISETDGKLTPPSYIEDGSCTDDFIMLTRQHLSKLNRCCNYSAPFTLKTAKAIKNLIENHVEHTLPCQHNIKRSTVIIVIDI